jgi:hypothetical protein
VGVLLAAIAQASLRVFVGRHTGREGCAMKWLNLSIIILLMAMCVTIAAISFMGILVSIERSYWQSFGFMGCTCLISCSHLIHLIQRYSK